MLSPLSKHSQQTKTDRQENHEGLRGWVDMMIRVRHVWTRQDLSEKKTLQVRIRGTENGRQDGAHGSNDA